MRTRFCCVFVILLLLLGAGCTEPSPSEEPLFTLENAEYSYAIVGESFSVYVRGMNLEPSKIQYTLSDPSLYTDYAETASGCTMTLVKEGTLKVIAQYEDIRQECTVCIVPAECTVSMDSPLITYLGRVEMNTTNYMLLNTASGFQVTFYGKKLTTSLRNAYGTTYISVLIDDQTDPEANKINLKEEPRDQNVVLAEFDTPGLHTVTVQKVTEESLSSAILKSVSVEGGSLIETKKEDSSALKLEFYGDSITCGYGNIRTNLSVDLHVPEMQNGLLTYAAITARNLNADYTVIAKSGIGLVMNPFNLQYNMIDVYNRISPDSNPSGKWDMIANVPDIVVINLGENDCNTQGFTTDKLRKGYIDFAHQLVNAYGDQITIIFCSGMMSQIINEPCAAAAQALKQEGLNAYAVVLSPKDDHIGHPCLKDHQASAEILTEAIREIWNKNK